MDYTTKCCSLKCGSVTRGGLEHADYLSFCLCCCIFFFFCLSFSSDEKCQTWLPPEPTHLWPWPYQPWPSWCNQFPCLYQVYFGCDIFLLPFPWPACLPIVPVSAFAGLNGLQARGGTGQQRGVHISTFLPCWIKSIGSDSAHPEQTLTCFSTKPPAVKKRRK